MCETISTKTVTTREERTCFGCCEVIAKGTKTHTYKTRGDGRIYTIYLCRKCCETVNQIGYGESYVAGELKEMWV